MYNTLGKKIMLPLAAAVMMQMDFLISSIKGMNSSWRSRFFSLCSYLQAENLSATHTDPHHWTPATKGF